MSLSKQLLLLLSLIFFIIFSASLVLSLSNIKGYLEVESQFHVKNTATSLGLSLSPHIIDENDPILETMMAAIFDTGYYQEMRLVNIDGEELVKFTNPKAVPGVPHWFIDRVRVEVATATAEISSGWHMSGKLFVTANPAYGYLKLYQQVKSTLVISSLMFLAALILLVTVLRFTLRPLHDIADQAEQISAGNFTTITRLPWTREVKHVALSMNSMSNKIGQTVSSLNRRLETVSHSLKLDPLTKLLNQATFDIDLKHGLESYKSSGYAALIKFDNLGFLSKDQGNEAIDTLLREFASILKETEQFKTTAYRLQGSEFALLFPSFDEKSMIGIIKQLKDDIDVLGQSYQQQDLIHIGIIRYERSSDFDKLYPGMVEAYEQATNISNNAYFVKEDLTSSMSDIEWKSLIINAIANKEPAPEITFTAEAHDYKQVPAQKVMEEAFTMIRDDKGQSLSIGTFFSMAQEFQLIEALDEHVTNKVITIIEHNNQLSPVTINLSMESVSSNAFNVWLKERLSKTKCDLKLLSFSVTAYSASKDLETFASFARAINALGATVLLKRYSPDIIDIEQLKSLNINYLRLARDLTTNIASNPNKIQFLDLIGEVADLLDIKVLAEGVESNDDLDLVKAKSIYGISR